MGEIYSYKEYMELESKYAELTVLWGRGKFLLKKIAGWTEGNPAIDPVQEARDYLREIGENPPEWGEQSELL